MEFFTKGGNARGTALINRKRGQRKGHILIGQQPGIGYGKRSTCFLERTDLHRQWQRTKGTTDNHGKGKHECCCLRDPSSPGVFVSLTIKAGKRGTYLSDLADGLKLEVGVTIYVNTKGVAGFFFWVAGKGESQSSVIAPVWPLFFLKSVMELIQESGHFWTLSLPSICNCYSKIVVLGFLLWWKKVSSLILNKPIDKGLQKRHDGVRQEVGLG